MVESLWLQLKKKDCTIENIPKIMQSIKKIYPSFSAIDNSNDLIQNTHKLWCTDFTLMRKIGELLQLTPEKYPLCTDVKCTCYSTELDRMYYFCNSLEFMHGILNQITPIEYFRIGKDFWGSVGLYTERESIFYILLSLIKTQLLKDLEISVRLDLSDCTLTEDEITICKSIVKQILKEKK